MVEIRFLQALAGTIVIETLCLLILLKYTPLKKQAKRTKTKHILIAGVLTSALTLPYLWFILPRFLNAAYSVWIGEVIVVLAEWLILAEFRIATIRK